MLKDSFGRGINYLRLSLTDRCNLRCVYCMPLEGLSFLPDDERLSPTEYELVVRAAVRVGFSKFRLTGGEPTLHPELVEIVERIARVIGDRDLSMTTNGVLLPDLADDLARAGLKRVNVHLDSVDAGNVERVMRGSVLGKIQAGIEAAERAGLAPIKINAVVVQGYNDRDVADLARLTLDRDWHVRFIELMPIGEGECETLARNRFVSNERTRQRIEEELGRLERIGGGDPSDEATNFRAADARGIIGFISPVSAPYCGACNRMRLTADGKFHLCLLNDDELDVRRVIRGGGGVEQVEVLLRRAVALKPNGHHLKQRIAAGVTASGPVELTFEGQDVVTVGPSIRNRDMYQLGG